MQERTPTEKQKSGRTSFLALFSQCPSAILPTLCCGTSFAAASHYCNSFGFGYSFQHHGRQSPISTSAKQPLSYMLFPFHHLGSIFACSVHIPFCSSSCCYRGGLVPPCHGHHLATHTACRWMYPSSSPAVTSSCKPLGRWAPPEILKQMVTPA